MKIRALGVALVCAATVGGVATSARAAEPGRASALVRCDYAKVKELTVAQAVAKLPAGLRGRIVKSPLYVLYRNTKIKDLPPAVQDKIRAECAR